MQLLLSISLHQPISETYPSSKTCLSLSKMCLCFLNFTEMAIIGSQLAWRQTSTEEIYMHISHKTYLSLSTRQRRICLQIFKVKCVCVSYTVLKWPAQVPSVLKDKHQHMQLLLSNSLHQPTSKTYPSSQDISVFIDEAKTNMSLDIQRKICLCFLYFPKMAITGSKVVQRQINTNVYN